jgi:hypothetical protein
MLYRFIKRVGTYFFSAFGMGTNWREGGLNGGVERLGAK